jgi:beta-aspartyl-peptidase (threonine type)
LLYVEVKYHKMNNIAIAVHGGAGPDSELIKNNIEGYKKGLEDAVQAGYKVLQDGGGATDAVEAAVKTLEDNPLFNAGRGSELNEQAEVEMGASIMEGNELKSGAAAIVRNVRNPVTLARAIMEKSKYIYLGDNGAVEFANKMGITLEPDAYFITDHAMNVYLEERKARNEEKEKQGGHNLRRSHGTVGAVAVDSDGNVAAATSTGGTEYKTPGRIADSSMIGIGTYANNRLCAVSATGDGEYLMQQVAAYDIAALIDYKGLNVQDALHHFIHVKCKDVQGDMGLICVDPQGNIAMEYNSDRMHRASISSKSPLQIRIYKED